MNENRILLFLCISLCSSFLGLYIFIEIEQWSQFKEYGRLPISNNKPPPFHPASIVASALTSITRSPVITYHDYSSRDENDTKLYEQLDFSIFHKTHLSGRIISSHRRKDDETLLFGVYVESLTGTIWLVENLHQEMTVQELKERIQEGGIASDTISQYLVFEGQHLLNTVKLGTYNIGQDHIIYLSIRPSYENSLYPVKFLSSDFSKLRLEQRHRKNRHGIHGKRCEWIRIPLTPSTKSRSWPSSYHGTSTRHARTIADDGLLYSKNHRFDFDHGIFTTPDMDLASLYAQSFVHNGSKYLVLLENRVNPKTLVKLSFKKGGDYWVSPSEDDVKPSGLLIKKIGYCE